jgi:hypothetical protein
MNFVKHNDKCETLDPSVQDVGNTQGVIEVVERTLKHDISVPLISEKTKADFLDQ